MRACVRACLFASMKAALARCDCCQTVRYSVLVSYVHYNVVSHGTVQVWAVASRELSNQPASVFRRIDQ
jgi:hypothetical protein